MHKRIQKYQNSGVLTGGSNLTPPLPQPASLTSNPYTVPWNGATTSYQNLGKDWAADFGKKAEQIMAPTNNLIDFNAMMGDPLSMVLKNNRDTTNTLNALKDMRGSSSVTPAGSKKGGMSAGLQKGLSAAGNMMASAYDAIPTLDKVHNENDATTAEIRGTASKALLSGAAGPWGMVAGAALMGFDKTGGFTDASQGLGKKDDTLNAIASLAIPGAGWFTKKTIDYKVSDTLKQSGASYGGTLDKANTAAKNAGAKILFGKSKANRMIANAKLADTKVNNIMDENNLAMEASNNPLIGLGTQMQLNGGYQQNTVRAGKSGLKMDREFAKRVIKLSNGKKSKAKKIQEEVRMEEVAGFQKGGSIDGMTGAAPKITFESWYNMIPEDRRDTTSYNLRRAFELAPREELEAWRTSSVSDLKAGKNHLSSVYLDPKTGVYEFMKAKDHPTLKYELDWYNSNDPEAIQFRNSYDLDKSGDYYRYVPKKFKNGGAVNVIPDGALHAHKHHLEDVDGKFEEVTTKGIPVITEEKGGDIKQHAEVEREEIIFNLDVTKQLEKLMQDGSDEAAIEAGKLLVHEILENTVDNTGLLKTVE